MLKNLQYERIAQLIAIAAIDKHDSSAVSQLGIKDIILNSRGEFESRSILVRFSNYVKSQIHLCIVEDLYGRSMLDYIETLKYLDGYRVYRDKAAKVLQYFYFDMAHFLINNPYNLQLHVVIDADFEEDTVNISEIKRQFQDILSASDTDEVYAKSSDFQYANIIDNVDDLQDAKAKIDSYVMAAVLDMKAKEKDVKRIKLEDFHED